MLRVASLIGASAETIGSTALMGGSRSLAATELSARLRAETGLSLSPTLLFEQPTPRAVAAHLVALAMGGAAPPEQRPSGRRAAVSECALAVVGAVGRWPGGVNGARGRLALQGCSGDALGAVPSLRWTLALVIDVGHHSAAQLQCARHGGFVHGAQRFDSAAFGLASVEASAMDPQQRLLAEAGYAALHASSQRRALLSGGDGGVFLGIERPEWALARPPASRGSVYSMTGDNVSVAAGRLSFVLGLHGPCASVDTACASSLCAMH